MMGLRAWFYLAFIIILIGLVSWWAAGRNQLNQAAAQQLEDSQRDQERSLKGYLAKQTDSRKLVSLAKRLKNADSAIIRLVVERAYELNPNSRDIALLASFFNPELKDRVRELDPLYKFQLPSQPK